MTHITSTMIWKFSTIMMEIQSKSTKPRSMTSVKYILVIISYQGKSLCPNLILGSILSSTFEDPMMDLESNLQWKSHLMKILSPTGGKLLFTFY